MSVIAKQFVLKIIVVWRSIGSSQNSRSNSFGFFLLFAKKQFPVEINVRSDYIDLPFIRTFIKITGGLLSIKVLKGFLFKNFSIVIEYIKYKIKSNH